MTIFYILTETEAFHLPDTTVKDRRCETWVT